MKDCTNNTERNPVELNRLIEELEHIYQTIHLVETKMKPHLSYVHPVFSSSASNLLDYLVLRSFDIRPYQEQLSNLGLSSLRTAEGYVRGDLENILLNLKLLQDHTLTKLPNKETKNYTDSKKKLRHNTTQLFGKHKSSEHTRIMVTLPTQAADEVELIEQMAHNGMEVARINLGHDNETVWLKMVENCKKASKKLGLPISIYMDLAGPKIRTQAIYKRGRKKKKTKVHAGMRLLLTKKGLITPKGKHLSDRALHETNIVISLPQIIDDICLGDPILFDDGMIMGKIIAKNKTSCEVRIEKCFKSKLRCEKGINLPKTKLNLPALTQQDIETLPFACKHAHVLGYSFVRNEKDVALLYEYLRDLKATDLGVVFKIENKKAFENFPDILLKGMERNRIGVMIARGDLAVEMGFERTSEVQKEILWLCEAAQIPVIWATQVLETLAKKGIATRAEISDAAEGARSECIMLNKGAHIIEAIRTLKSIVAKMDGHFSKKKESLRPLGIAKKYLNTTKNGIRIHTL